MSWRSASLVLLDWVSGPRPSQLPLPASLATGDTVGARWRPLMEVLASGRSKNASSLSRLAPRGWLRWKVEGNGIAPDGDIMEPRDPDVDDCGFDSGCDEDGVWTTLSNNKYTVMMITAIVLLLIIVVFLVSFVRRQMLRKRMSKGPLKIILNAGDLVFPDLPAHRGVVDESMEAMLSCFLQQLTDMGGAVPMPETNVPWHLGTSEQPRSPTNPLVFRNSRN